MNKGIKSTSDFIAWCYERSEKMTRYAFGAMYYEHDAKKALARMRDGIDRAIKDACRQRVAERAMEHKGPAWVSIQTVGDTCKYCTDRSGTWHAAGGGFADAFSGFHSKCDCHVAVSFDKGRNIAYKYRTDEAGEELSAYGDAYGTKREQVVERLRQKEEIRKRAKELGIKGNKNLQERVAAREQALREVERIKQLGARANGEEMAFGWGNRLMREPDPSLGRKTGKTSGLLGVFEPMKNASNMSDVEKALKEAIPGAMMTRYTKTLDHRAVGGFLASLLGTCEKTYGFIPPIRSIEANKNLTITNLALVKPRINGTVDIELSGLAFSDIETLRKEYGELVDVGRSAAGTSMFSIGAHEATHIAEWLIMRKITRTANDARAISTSQIVGREIFSRAVAKVEGIQRGDVTKEMLKAYVDDYSDNVSTSTKRSIREAMCEAAQDIDCNGEGAYYFSKYLFESVKEMLDENGI